MGMNERTEERAIKGGKEGGGRQGAKEREKVTLWFYVICFCFLPEVFPSSLGLQYDFFHLTERTSHIEKCCCKNEKCCSLARRLSWRGQHHTACISILLALF